MNWWSRNAGAIEALAATITAIVAVIALVGVKYQLDAADDLQRSQSARDAYRSHLALASTQSEFAKPSDACVLISGPDAGAYMAFVDHLLYSAEQMLDVEEGWNATFAEALAPHAAYMCSKGAPSWSTSEMASFLETFESNYCVKSIGCE